MKNITHNINNEFEAIQNKRKEIEKRLVEKFGNCEACESFGVQWELRQLASNIMYNLCSNCLISLITHNLSKVQFKNILKNGHSQQEILLENDFYDEKGNALQPLIKSN